MDYISDKEFYSYINEEKCYELISKYVLTDSQLETFFTKIMRGRYAIFSCV